MEASEAAGTPHEDGLGVPRLEAIWSRVFQAHRGRATPVSAQQAHQDHWVLHALGIGLEPFYAWFRHGGSSYAEFERWVLQHPGRPSARKVARLNAALTGQPIPGDTREELQAIERMAPVLSAQDLAFWEEHGYVVLHDAVPPEDAAAVAEAIWHVLGAHPGDPTTWYPPNDHGIMVQLFHHAALERNRCNCRIHKAFSQLWCTADLWSTTDRVGFNAPETATHRFRGPHLHWDVSLQTPVPLGTQGILYLTDTQAEQGAFTLVPGFHRRLDAWLAGLPGGPAAARDQDMDQLGPVPIAGRAGDLIIWHHALPHGSRPNTTRQPRLVQYINLFPADAQVQENWV